MSDLFEEMADAAADLSSAPTDAQISELRARCMEFAETDSLVSRLEDELESAKEKRNVLAHKTLPDLFGQLRVDSFGLPEVGERGADVVLLPYYKASIPADWPEEKKAEAFDHLEQIDGGDLIRTEVKFTLGRGQTELARTIVAVLRTLGHCMGNEGLQDLPEPSVSMGVPWNSLTSFIKERHSFEQSAEFARLLEESGTPDEYARKPITMDLSVLNATVGQVVKIKERKK